MIFNTVKSVLRLVVYYPQVEQLFNHKTDFRSEGVVG